jgi:hypothetical protein
MDEQFTMRPTPAARKAAPVAAPVVETTERDEPRISMLPLTEFLTAGQSRQKTIVHAQRHPRKVRTAIYRLVELAIARSLVSGSDEPLLEVRQALRAGTGDWFDTRREVSNEALQAFQRWRDGDHRDLGRLIAAPNPRAPWKVSEVIVSVRPQLLVVAPDGAPIGALKLSFGKQKALGKDRARYAGTLLHQYVEESLGASCRAEARRCFVLDVLHGQLWQAPASQVRLRRDITAGCEVFALRWPHA